MKKHLPKVVIALLLVAILLYASASPSFDYYKQKSSSDLHVLIFNETDNIYPALNEINNRGSGAIIVVDDAQDQAYIINRPNESAWEFDIYLETSQENFKLANCEGPNADSFDAGFIVLSAKRGAGSEIRLSDAIAWCNRSGYYNAVTYSLDGKRTALTKYATEIKSAYGIALDAVTLDGGSTGAAGNIQIIQGGKTYNISSNDTEIKLKPEPFSFVFTIDDPATQAGIFVGNVEQKKFYSNGQAVIDTSPARAFAAASPQTIFFFSDDDTVGGKEVVSGLNAVLNTRCHSFDTATKTCTWSPDAFGSASLRDLDGETLYIVYLDESDNSTVSFKISISSSHPSTELYWSSLVVSKSDGSFDISQKHVFTQKKSTYRLKDDEMRPFLLGISNYDPEKELIIGVGTDMHCQKILDYVNTNVQQERTDKPSAGFIIGAGVRMLGGGIAEFAGDFWGGLTAAARELVSKEDLEAIRVKKQTFGIVLQVNDASNLESDKIYPFPLGGLDGTVVPELYLKVKAVNEKDVKGLSEDLEIVACQFEQLPHMIEPDESEILMQFGDAPPGVKLNYKGSTTSSPGKDTTVKVEVKETFSIVATGLLDESGAGLFLFKNKNCEGSADKIIPFDSYKASDSFTWTNLNWSGVSGSVQNFCACQAQGMSQCPAADSEHKTYITIRESKGPEMNSILEALAWIDKLFVSGIFG